MTTQSLRSLADLAYATYYATEPDIDHYLRAELMLHADEPLTRASLIRAIDDDIHDLLHNANLADLLPFADDLDDDYDALSRRIDDTRFTAMISRRILDNSYPDMR